MHEPNTELFHIKNLFLLFKIHMWILCLYHLHLPLSLLQTFLFPLHTLSIHDLVFNYHCYIERTGEVHLELPMCVCLGLTTGLDRPEKDRISLPRSPLIAYSSSSKDSTLFHVPIHIQGIFQEGQLPFGVNLMEFLNNSAQPGLKTWVCLPFPSLSPFLPFLFFLLFLIMCVWI